MLLARLLMVSLILFSSYFLDPSKEEICSNCFHGHKIYQNFLIRLLNPLKIISHIESLDEGIILVKSAPSIYIYKY